jgi:predicted nucleic acid-binding protein
VSSGFLLDTNVISEGRRKRPNSRVVSWFQRTDPASLHISVLTLGEIANGAARYAKRDQAQAAMLEQWLDATRLNYADRVIAVDAEISETWGRLGARRPLPVIDGLLAATALVHGMTLVTRNVEDIADTGVALLDPWNA